MLEYMHVKNLALIEECEIQFTEGLNILTGETGAGKSVLLGSVNLALGAKADKDIIRTGASEAYVELMFSSNASSGKILESMELPSEDDSIIISRKITPTKNVFKINGEAVPARQVKELASELLDVHGQHEHQSLLNNLKQRDMLDAFGLDAVKVALERVSANANEYNKLKEELDEALSHCENREREQSLLEYECREIETANLILGEDEQLESDFKRMQSAEKLLSYVNEAMSAVSSDRGNDAGNMISRALNLMKKAAMLDDNAEGLAEKLSTIEELLGDFSLEISEYADGLEFSEEEFSEVETRLNTINSLKAKFGRTIPDILKYYEEKSDELEKLTDLDSYLASLKEKTDKAFGEYIESARKLSELRKSVAKDFARMLKEELLHLSFLDVKFDVEIETDESIINSKGFDHIEFMVSTNPGEPIKPIRNVASGGELSRIMLGIKSLLARKDEVDSLIFDEIDAGISGKTAWEVAGRLSALSNDHQVIAITHLPQIAAMADSHYEISKTSGNGVTTTSILRLDADGEILELSRLLGSGINDEATLNNAKELKKQANERKNR